MIGGTDVIMPSGEFDAGETAGHDRATSRSRLFLVPAQWQASAPARHRERDRRACGDLVGRLAGAAHVLEACR